MKNLAKGALIGTVIVLALVGVLSLCGCHDHDRKRNPLICAPCRGHGETRTYETPIEPRVVLEEGICFPEARRVSTTCWYGCPEPFPAAARCGADQR